MHLSHIRRWILDSPPIEFAIDHIRELLVGALKKGPVPQHVAFVMDGNRRFARSHGIETIEGHNLGFEALARILEVCYKSGVQVVTIYAFSIENFKRNPLEVAKLFNMFKEKFSKLLDEADTFNEHGVCIRFIGDWARIPSHMKPLLAKVTAMTRHNTKFRLNFAFVYTARNEITRGVQDLWMAVDDGQLSIDDLSVPLLDEVIRLTSTKNPVDLLVRTSNCTRLSDYMLWQSTEAILHFVPVLWPQYTLWEFQKSIFFYQRQRMLMKKLKLPEPPKFDIAKASDKVQQFLKDLEDAHWEMIEEHAEYELVQGNATISEDETESESDAE